MLNTVPTVLILLVVILVSMYMSRIVWRHEDEVSGCFIIESNEYFIYSFMSTGAECVDFTILCLSDDSLNISFPIIRNSFDGLKRANLVGFFKIVELFTTDQLSQRIFFGPKIYSQIFLISLLNPILQVFEHQPRKQQEAFQFFVGWSSFSSLVCISVLIFSTKKKKKLALSSLCIDWV